MQSSVICWCQSGGLYCEYSVRFEYVSLFILLHSYYEQISRYILCNQRTQNCSFILNEEMFSNVGKLQALAFEDML